MIIGPPAMMVEEPILKRYWEGTTLIGVFLFITTAMLFIAWMHQLKESQPNLTSGGQAA
jgi:uncharacterized membrane protein YjdF